MSLTFRSLVSAVVPALSLIAATACNAPDGAAPASAQQNNSGTVAQSETTQALSTSKVVGDTCQSNDPSHICLSLNYVAYKDSNGQPIVDEKTAIDNVRAINRVWAACDISFQIENFQAVAPADYQLAYGSQAQNELDQIRKAFGDDSSLLIVTTGPWGSVKNAWTAMPGSGSYGAILESSVKDYPNIIAHELGHYLSLDHVSDTANVMDAIIYPNSTQLDSSQCQAARSTAQGYWKKMLR